MNTARSHSVETAWTRVVQKALVAMTQPPRNASEPPRITLGTKRTRCTGVARKRASKVTATKPSTIRSGMIVVIFQTMFSTTA